MEKRNKERADVALVARALAESREKARALIMAGVVYKREQRVEKPSDMIGAQEPLSVRGAANPYVSRGALKLEKALGCFEISPAGLTCMDLGASTGGFTDVLLRAGAARVYAIDVGFGQLDWRIRSDARVVVMERQNARAITQEMFPILPTLAVMDVSFISIRLILPAAARVLGPDGRVVTLIKPQFEAGRERVGKKGVVGDPRVHEDVVRMIAGFAPTVGYRMRALDFSPITGPEGNIEFLADLVPAPEGAAGVSPEEIAQVVRLAHQTLRPAGRA